jgi:hypothetical protein
MSFAEVAADGRWARPHVKRDGARELFAKNARTLDRASGALVIIYYEL